MVQLEVSRPSHHLNAVWNLLGSKCSPRPVEEMTDSQAAVCEADTDKRRVLLAREKGLEKMLFDLCRQGGVRITHIFQLW